MKKCLSIFALALVALITWSQVPPLPPVATLRPVRIAWDAQPAADYWNSVDTNGLPVPIVFRVYNATNILGPWEVVATTTNLTAVISNLTARTQFFRVSASNFFLESDPSRVVSIPLDPPGRSRIVLE